MKKILIIAVVIAVAAIGCKNGKNKSMAESTAAPAGITADAVCLKTLNAIDFKTADTMINHFQKYRGQDKRPRQMSIWFSKQAIKDMINVIKEDSLRLVTQSPGRQDLPDGIRIYFGSNISIKKGQLENTILMVSTQKGGVDSTVPSGFHHKDYYEHTNLQLCDHNSHNSFKGEAPRERGDEPYKGEDLYTPCNSDCDMPGTGRHYITRKKAYAMGNAFANNVITTNSEWFDLDLFKTFANDTKSDGVRIYFTRHPEDVDGKPDDDYPLQAFVLVPTIPLGSYHQDDFKNVAVNKFISKQAKSIKILGGGQDNGEICPTHCD